MPVSGGPTACVCFSTGCHHHSVAASKRSAQGQVKQPIPYTTKRCRQISWAEEQAGPGDPGARVVLDHPSQMKGHCIITEACTAPLTPRAFQPNSIRSLSLGMYYSIGLLSSVLSTLPRVPAKSTTEGSNREVLLRCGTERRAEDNRACDCQRGCRGSQRTEHPKLLPQPHMGQWLTTTLSPSVKY